MDRVARAAVICMTHQICDQASGIDVVMPCRPALTVCSSPKRQSSSLPMGHATGDTRIISSRTNHARLAPTCVWWQCRAEDNAAAVRTNSSLLARALQRNTTRLKHSQQVPRTWQAAVQVLHRGVNRQRTCRP